MGLFNSDKKKQRIARRDNKLLIERLDGKAVKYVAMRDPLTSEERVIGKSGRINTKNEMIAIVCDGTEVFRCPAQLAQCGELMSLNGVVIRCTDGDGSETIVVAYYLYYRKT